MLKAKDKQASRGNWITFAIVLALTLITMVLENVMSPGSLLFTVIKKGAVYSLVAVSMNLLNGFTGLFSLGQAGFMTIGAYTYAIFTIPVKSRASVYYLYGVADWLKNIELPVIIALIVAGLAAALLAAIIGAPVLRLKSDYLAIATLPLPRPGRGGAAAAACCAATWAFCRRATCGSVCRRSRIPSL